MVYIYDKNTSYKKLFNICNVNYIFKLDSIPLNLKNLKIESKNIEYYLHKYVSEETKNYIEEFISRKNSNYGKDWISIFDSFLLITDNDKNKFIIKILNSNEKGERFSLRKFKSKIY